MKECPTCHRAIGGKGRFCFACKMPVLRNHKWHIVGYYIIHDDCQNPTMRVLIEAPEEQPNLIIEESKDAA